MLLLKEKRTEKGLSQYQLAAMSGIAQQTISSIESGSRPNPGILTLYPIAQALGCSVDDLYTKDNETEVSA